MQKKSSRRSARIVTGVLAGAALVIALPVAASAHIHVTPSDSAAATTTTLTFSFSHGCEESPTTALAVDIPEGVTNVVPVAQGGWSIERDTAENGTVSRVTFVADAPIEGGVKGEVSLDARFDETLADTDVAFPVTQECVAGSTAWTEVAVDGEAEPESPAPVVAVGAVADETGEHGHSDSDHDETAASTDADASAAPADTTALWLGGAGLGLGIIALGVAVAALVRRKA